MGMMILKVDDTNQSISGMDKINTKDVYTNGKGSGKDWRDNTTNV